MTASPAVRNLQADFGQAGFHFLAFAMHHARDSTAPAGRPKSRHSAGTMKRLSSVEVKRPTRITTASGCSIHARRERTADTASTTSWREPRIAHRFAQAVERADFERPRVLPAGVRECRAERRFSSVTIAMNLEQQFSTHSQQLRCVKALAGRFCAYSASVTISKASP